MYFYIQVYGSHFFFQLKKKKKKDENLMGKKVSKLQLRDSKVNIYYFCII